MDWTCYTDFVAEPAEAKEQPAPSGSKLPILIVLLNTIAIFAALGTFVYTRVLFKRPAITEEGERAKLAEAQARSKAPPVSGLVNFEPVTVNIKSTPTTPKPEIEAQPGEFTGKLHYATVAFSFEIRDISKKEDIEALRPILLDRILSMMGRKNFEELTTVQGRYVLRTQILDLVNNLLKAESKDRDNAVTNVFFNQFIVQ